MRFTGLLAIAILSVPASAANNGPWIEVRTPNFRVISNGSERQARNAALGFEQMKAIFPKVLSNVRTDSGAEMIIFAVQDERTMRDLLPVFWKQSGRMRPAGILAKGWEKDFAVARVDVSQSEQVVFHEYIHELVALNFANLPTWLNEGLAEFFANSRIENDRVLVGTPSPRINDVRNSTPIKLSEFVDPEQSAKYYGSEQKAQLFYAQSWLLTHFLMFSEGMGNGTQLLRYLRELKLGADPQIAFAQTFGDINILEKRFIGYFLKYAFPTFVVRTSVDTSSKGFSVRALPESELEATLAIFYEKTGEADLAEKHIQAALSADAKSWLAHENRGLIWVDRAKDQDAAEEFATAIGLNPEAYLSRYYAAALASRASHSRDEFARDAAAMERVLAANPNFAPAEVQRSIALARMRRFAEAEEAANHSVILEPTRAGYRLNQAEISLAKGDSSTAVTLAATVAKQWHGPDAAEAVDLLTRACTDATSGTDPCKAIPELAHTTGLAAVQGEIVSITCKESRPTELKLRTQGSETTYDVKQLKGAGHSDNFWFTSDRTSCERMQGERAVIRYKPGTSEALWIELRNSLHLPAAQLTK